MSSSEGKFCIFITDLDYSKTQHNAVASKTGPFSASNYNYSVQYVSNVAITATICKHLKTLGSVTLSMDNLHEDRLLLKLK